ncbi:MAG: Ribonuclease D [uncultured Frankineae bacterium]|uniref:Ribonuclease D n=1 Tax=uncultured Frankineae bacterium TaxID=437475 RepID=A0A6J4LRD3_9ACTN|nr:MAG: Ribonuclease D [uncultured Frankineae bacterium]
MTTTLPGHEEGVSGDEPGVRPLLAPSEGVPPVVETAAALDEVVARFAAGTGPTAVDAERASGYRYSQRAYLVQLRRAGAGTALIDPLGCPDLSQLSEAVADDEWVLHAASQDLACLAEVGLVPTRIFDTELAGRLSGFDRVGLGAMVERVLGLRLEKGHSAADWSTRPLPEAWLVYAALDVEVLVELRDRLEQELRAQGKLELAREEFEAVRQAPAPAPRTDPWRRTSGIHRMRNRRQLAAVRALWEVRDDMARRRDIAPGRILPDSALVAAVQADPQTPAALLALPVFGGRSTRRHVDTWFGALQAARALPEDALPSPVPPGDAPPQANRWAERDPVAARRLARVRAVVTGLAEELRMPQENLVQPEAVRRLAWTPPDPVDEDAVAAALRAHGAREWQVLRVAEPLTAALPEPADPAAPSGG